MSLIAEVGSITDPGTEAIVNAANGVGFLGHGTAGAIKEDGGDSVVVESARAFSVNKKPFEPGECYVTGSGNLNQKGVTTIFHAVTMKYPGGIASLHDVNKAMRAVLEQALKIGVKSIAFPGLGTGIGRLDKTSVARVMVSIAKEVADKIDIKFVDLDAEFIQEVNANLGKEDGNG